MEPKILQIGDLPDYCLQQIIRTFNQDPIELPKNAFSTGWQPHFRSHLNNIEYVFVRPSASGILRKKYTKLLKPSCSIVTLSVGTDHIEDSEISVIKPRRSYNAESTADLAFTLGKELLRPSHRGIEEMKRGIFRNSYFLNSKTTYSMSWGLLGFGQQAKAMLPHLLGANLKQIVICTPRINNLRIYEFLKQEFNLNVAPAGDRYELPTWNTKKTVTLIWTRNFVELCKQSDIVSMHIDSVPETKNYIDRKKLKHLDGKYLINTSRGDRVVEIDVANSIKNRELAGYAADVINGDAEGSENIKDSVIWKMNHDDKDYLYNIILTPHCGGTVEVTIKQMCDDVFQQLVQLMATEV